MIDRTRQAYYHCCRCSSYVSSYDICEVCVAGRGCSCPDCHDHILYRRGLLGPKADLGELEPLQEPESSRRRKAKKVRGEDPPLEPQKSKARFTFSKSNKSETSAASSDLESNLPDLVKDDDDSVSLYSVDKIEMMLNETDYSISLGEQGQVRSDMWSPRSWWPKN